MKRIVTTLATLALAATMAAPVFAAKAPKGQAQTKTAAVKTTAKHHRMSKKRAKTARRAAAAKSATPSK